MLSRVAFGSGSALKRIGNAAFYGCTGLQEIEIPAGVEEIGTMAFSRCNIENFRIAESNPYYKVVNGCLLFHIESKSIVCCLQNVSEVEIPDYAEIIGERCFAASLVYQDDYDIHDDWSFLSKITFGPGSCIEKIGEYAFLECGNLKWIEIPPRVQILGNALRGCCPDRITFASGSCMKQIDGERDWFWVGEEIVFPANLEEFVNIVAPPGPFLCIHGRVDFESGCRLKILTPETFRNSHLQEIKIPASVEEIGDACFEEAYSLEVITFEKGSRLKKIGDSPFIECPLRKIEIPASVEEIGDYCFDCPDIESITFEEGSRLRDVGVNAFPDHINIELPNGLVLRRDD